MNAMVLSDPPRILAYGFAFYKKKSLRAFFPQSEVVFIDELSKVASGDVLAVWGNTTLEESLVSLCRVIRIEDGFIRSVGLGADFIPPISWVGDCRGMYFDANRSSDLEGIFLEQKFDVLLCARAAALRQKITSAKLTKYNVGTHVWSRPVTDKSIILVLGQVETDASIEFGSPVIKKNIGLLKTIRQAHPEAYIVYKPHPDVAAKLRLQGEDEASAAQFCDEIVENENLANMLTTVDEVHTLTSLAGFEALMRGVPVHCYGQPFYAGWGLTTDHYPVARRARKLTLDELVAGALICYPRYLSLNNRRLITPEQAINELIALREKTQSQMSWWRYAIRPFVQMIARYEDGKRKKI